jgi:hypothetical protein
MKNQNQTQPTLIQNDKLISKLEEPPPTYFRWNDNKDELGMEDEWEPENFKNENEKYSKYIEPLS